MRPGGDWTEISRIWDGADWDRIPHVDSRPQRTSPRELVTADLLGELEDCWRSCGAPFVDDLAPGLDDDEIDRLVEPFGLHLPGEVRAWYRWHDGLRGNAGPWHGEYAVSGSMRSAPLAGALANSEMMRRVYCDERLPLAAVAERSWEDWPGLVAPMWSPTMLHLFGDIFGNALAVPCEHPAEAPLYYRAVTPDELIVWPHALSLGDAVRRAVNLYRSGGVEWRGGEHGGWALESTETTPGPDDLGDEGLRSHAPHHGGPAWRPTTWPTPRELGRMAGVDVGHGRDQSHGQASSSVGP